MRNDNFDVIKEIFDGWIFNIISRANAREVSRFRYLSYDWISPRGWYFWPKNRPGVYALKEIAAIDAFDQGRFDLGLYYYPHPDEDVFQHYSFAEQMVRVSPLFSTEGVRFQVTCLLHSPDEADACGSHEHACMDDLKNGKGVPTIDAREQLNPALFLIGYVHLSISGKRPVQITMESPERSTTMATNDVFVPDSSGGDPCVIIGAREVDRNLPAWELAMEFCESLAGEIGAELRSMRDEAMDVAFNSAIMSFTGCSTGVDGESLPVDS